MKVIVGAIFLCWAAVAQPNWVQVSPSTPPAPRGSHAMAWDGEQVVLFGGLGAGAYLGDTWLWNGSQWNLAAPNHSPSPRLNHSIAYDPVRNQVVLFGGNGAAQPGNPNGVFGDTWVWNGVDWTDMTPSPLTATNSPPPRYSARLAFDAVNQEMVLYGGRSLTSTNYSDVWTWNGSIWTQRDPIHPFPARNFPPAAAWDPVGQQILFYGGIIGGTVQADMWSWKNYDFTQLGITTPPARAAANNWVTDTGNQLAVLYGGSGAGGAPFDDTWFWNGSAWTKQSPAVSPGPVTGAYTGRSSHAMAFDASRGQVVMFGGADAFGGLLGDTWTYTPGAQPANVKITVPFGAGFTFNGINYTGSHSIPVTPGTYTLSTTSPQATAPGTQLAFSNWSDGGAISHPVAVPAGGVNITGAFTTQYLLGTVANPSAGGTVSGGGFYDAGATASPTATPNAGFSSANWSGACSGSGACSVTMNAPATVTANFNAALVQFTVNVPATAQFTFNGTTYTGTQTIAAPPGSYTLAATSPQSTAAGTQLAFVSWSDGGGISHTVTLSGAAQSITGTFKTQYLLTTSALPVSAGVVAPLSGGPYFDSGALVNVGSAANAGFQFQYWTGACAGSAPVCQVLMNAPQTVVGNFTVPPKWIQLGPANSPTARYSSGMAFDAGRNEMVLFGGIAGPSYVGDTWTWNGTNWNLRSSAGPSPRAGVALAYDPAHGQMVMFGGTTPASSVNETWIWDGNAGVWAQQNPAVSPSPRYFASLAWDGTRLILFGGYSGAVYLNDTWAWTGFNWVQLAPATSPAARGFAAMTYDAARNQVVLFGGQNAGVLGDTWIWTGSNWVARAPVTSPIARSAAAFAYDPVIQQSVLFAGFGVAFPDEVWLWDGVNWKSTPESPSPSDRYTGAVAYDPARRQVLLFGGFDSASEGDTWIFANNATQQFYTLSTAANPVGSGAVAAVSPGQVGPSYRAGSTVTLTASSSPAAPFGYWSGACAGAGSGACKLTMLSNLTAIANYPTPPKWIQLGPVHTPLARFGAGVAYDPTRQEVVLFGGAGNSFLGDTWIWNGTDWTMRSPVNSPVARGLAAMAYDPVHQKTVLFGGDTLVNGGQSNLADTWVWDGVNWTQMNPPVSPSARSGAQMAWDGSRIILFGGSLIDQNTWAWNGANWTQLAPATKPPGRFEFTMTYDAARRQIVMFGGTGSGGILGDTWLWTGSDWVQKFAATSPSVRRQSMTAYDAAIQQVVLFAGDKPGGAFFSDEVWLWDGNNWRQQSQTPSPKTRSIGSMVYDEARQQVVLFGGVDYSNGQSLGDTWIYANNAVQQFYTLTTVANPAAGGTVSPAGTQSFRAGQLLAVAETPAAGREFQGWSGACAGSRPTCNVVLNGNTTVTANFGYPLSWLQLNPATSAPPKANLIFQNPISMAFDVARQQVVYFGGPAGDQTWTWNGTTWTKRAPAHSPAARSGHAMAYDAARQRVILFGGGNGVAFHDTWSWDGTDWTLVDAGTGPAKRFNHGMAYDRARQEIVMFGGLDENFNFYPDTWAWNGAQWILRQASGGPPVRSDFGMAFDPVKAEVVISSGYEGQNDTWGWNGNAWTRKFPAHQPPSTLNQFSQMAYDERLQRIVAVIDAYPLAPTTWVWNGLDWVQLNPTQSPTTRRASGIVYDGVRGQVLLFGGDGVGAPLNDTWVLSPPAAILSLQSVSATKNAAANYLVTFALRNTGNTAATTVFGFSATAVTLVGGASTTTNTFPLGQFSTIQPGASGTFQAQFPATAGPGAHSFSALGSYAVTGATGTWSVAVRSVVFP